MQSAEQQPRPEDEANGTNDTESEQKETPPLFEFPPDLETLQAPADEQEAPVAPQVIPPENAEVNQQAFEQAVRQGLIYPPPPSYYQNMPQHEERPAPVPPVASVAYHGQPQPFVAPPSTHPPLLPPMRPAAPPAAKRSRKWLWIVISVLAVAILASCGLCGWGFYTIFNTAYQSTSSSLHVINDFYANLQNQRYQAAYSDLDMPQLTLAQFTQEAQQADQKNGAIQSYTAQQPSFGLNSSNGPDLSHFTYVVNITRIHNSYSALITITQHGNSWKITDFDRL